ncbi:MAG: DUF3616 domain-containing protein [Pseudomonadota bacterium]
MFRLAFTAACLVLMAIAHNSIALASQNVEPVAEIKYFGVCDGSAALRIDDQTVLMANDENNILLSYDIWGGHPVASFDLADILHGLNEKDGRDRELDIEAVTELNKELFWIASNGRNKSGKKRPNRLSFFATSKPDRNLKNLKLVKDRVNLTERLSSFSGLSDLLTKEVLKTPPKEGGLNIEAMTTTPEGKLILGFRSPLDGEDGMEGNATLVTLANIDDQWQVESNALINLKDRGVRDMIRIDGGYLLIAGDVDSGGKFALYTLDMQLKPTKLKSLGKGELNPEALLALNDQLLVLSDDGSVKRKSDQDDDKKKCKTLLGKNVDQASDNSEVYFRGTVFTR